MAEFCYVDNSNVFISGQRVAAVMSNMSMNIYDAVKIQALVHSYKICFGKLPDYIAGMDSPVLPFCDSLTPPSRHPRAGGDPASFESGRCQ